MKGSKELSNGNEEEMKDEETPIAEAIASFELREEQLFQEERHQRYGPHDSTSNTSTNDRSEQMIGAALSTKPDFVPSEQHDYGEMLPPSTTNSRVLCGLKWTVLLILVVVGVAIATTAFLYSSDYQKTRFEEHFEDDAARFVSLFYQRQANKVWVLLATTGAIVARENYNDNENFPFVTVPEYEFQTSGHLHTSSSDSIFWAPLLYGAQQSEAWESYALENIGLADISFGSSEAIHNRTIEDGIFRIDYENDTFVDSPGDGGLIAPIWQVSPTEEKRHLSMFNLFSVEALQTPILLCMGSRIPLLSSILDQKTADFMLGKQERSLPRSLLVAPVLNTRNGVATTGIVAVEVDWITYFDNVLSGGPAVTIVLSSNCKQKHTYEVRGGVAKYLGEGDHHNERYNYLKKGANFAGFLEYWFDNLRAAGDKGGLPVTVFPDQGDTLFQLSNETFLKEIGVCVYAIEIYPTAEYYDKFNTSSPYIYMLVTVAIFVCVILLFFLYDILVERRQRRVAASAAKSDAMINSLFPAVIRDRLFRTNSTHSSGSGRANRRKSYTGRTAKTSEMSLLNDHGMVTSLTPKHRLTTFLKSSFHADSSFQMRGTDDDPIAEMFTNTTVMFADIAGFTAWSSEREPSQVFKLLETIYSAFDNIARRLHVFKVETIGDCYVAVTGLPNPQSEHAVLCAQFAYQCLLAMEQLTKQLDLTLGPGTSDLGLRIGLHSGPVTAGVLRGEKSRFQLFGDTVNTASRMESTGVPGRIQASQETAELIQRVGRQEWLSQRNETVTAKGKGELQTYWVYLGQRNEDYALDRLHEQAPGGCTNHRLVRLPSCDDNLSRPAKRGRAFEPPASRLSNISVDDSISSRFLGRCDRLVDWNVEVLMGFLDKLVQHRLETSPHQSNGCRLPSVDATRFIIDEVVSVIELPDFAVASRTRRADRMVKMLPPIVRIQLKEFVSCIASMYRDVPFHNFEHASHVTMSANKLMKRIITPDDHVDGSRKPLNPSELHSSTFGISSDPLVQFAVVFAALIHDVDHTGLSNVTLVQNAFPVAKIFGNKSVAEQNSVVVAWELLMEHRFGELQTCIFNNDHGRHRFRQLVVNAVMATDIMDRDMLQLRKDRWEKAFDSSSSESTGSEKQDINLKATIVIEHIIQASDVAHTFQHWHIFLKHNTRLYNEQYRSYKLGFTNQDPTDAWYDGEIGFLDHYVIPLAKKLKECGVFGVSGDEYLQYAEWNRKEWERKGRSELEKMVLQREDHEGPA